MVILRPSVRGALSATVAAQQDQWSGHSGTNVVGNVWARVSVWHRGAC
jgi:hypothetical protein